MKGHQRRSAGPGRGLSEQEKPGQREAGEVSEDDCRCKEVSKKTVPEMLKLMISDLAFWKKGRRA